MVNRDVPYTELQLRARGKLLSSTITTKVFRYIIYIERSAELYNIEPWQIFGFYLNVILTQRVAGGLEYVYVMYASIPV